MKLPNILVLVLLLASRLVLPATAHDEPTSFIDLRMNAIGMEVSITASTTDLANGLPDVEPDMLLQQETIAARREELARLILSKLKISGGANDLLLEPREMTPIAEKRDLHLVLHHAWNGAPETLRVTGLLFPYDPRHRTFLNIYSGEEILRQEILTQESTSIEFRTNSHQGLIPVIRNFIYQGIHHIFIGPDHILFVIGLMLLGGGLKQLLGIVTAFTLAHSITLGLATFRIISPPASLVEPVIALSIVFVGVHAIFGAKGRDPRLIFAFCFGLIHGFGFASVLQEMVLPREALGWSLFAFNVGVELGQVCIVLAVAPLLALVRRVDVRVADGVVAATALCITSAGAFWFFERVIG